MENKEKNHLVKSHMTIEKKSNERGQEKGLLTTGIGRKESVFMYRVVFNRVS